MNIREFKVNEHITLRLEEDKTIIYVDDEPFDQCKYLLLNIPVEEISSFDEIDSVDAAAERLDHSEEPREGKVQNIPPEVEFWGHCSNMQVWYENNYDTRLLHSNLAFPLLSKLTRLGDSIAKHVFKEEIAKRLIHGTLSTVIYLLIENYIVYLNDDELNSIINENIRKERLSFKELSSMKLDALVDDIEGLNPRQFNFLISHPKFNFLEDFLNVLQENNMDYHLYLIIYRKLEKLEKKKILKDEFYKYFIKLKKMFKGF